MNWREDLITQYIFQLVELGFAKLLLDCRRYQYKVAALGVGDSFQVAIIYGSTGCTRNKNNCNHILSVVIPPRSAMESVVLSFWAWMEKCNRWN
jgi:hypothetical protein